MFQKLMLTFLYLLFGSLTPTWLYAQEPDFIQVSLTLGSIQNQHFILKNDNPSTVSKGAVHVKSKMARLFFIDAERIRIEFVQPIHLSIATPDAENRSTESIFRSFVIRAPAIDVDRLKMLTKDIYLSYESFNPENIEEFIKEAKIKGYDKHIRDAYQGFEPPEVRQFTGLQFFVPIEHIGRPDGVKVFHLSITSEPLTRLPWWPIPLETTLHRQARDIKFIYSPNETLITEYFASLNQMKVRKVELEKLGWLDRLKKSSALSSKKTEPLENSQGNVVLFPSKLNCTLLFH